MTNKDRIIAISKKLGLTHVGSNISCLPVLEEIYAMKKPEDIVILDNAHAHLAHLVIKEHLSKRDIPGCYGVLKNVHPIELDAEVLIEKYGIHCDRKAGCDASGGSLGHGIGIGIGYALADRTRDVYVIVSDGSTQEGSTFEALRIAKSLTLNNLKIYANFNSYTAVARIDLDYWESCISSIGFHVEFRRTTNGLPELNGIQGHYLKIND